MVGFVRRAPPNLVENMLGEDTEVKGINLCEVFHFSLLFSLITLTIEKYQYKCVGFKLKEE